MNEDELDDIGSKVQKALDKLKDYSAIGTVEEFRTAMARMVPMKPVDKTMVLDREDYVGDVGRCPVCGNIVTEDDICCGKCYQVLDWKVETVNEIEVDSNKFDEAPAAILPEGWIWRMCRNGTGYLMDPEGDKHYIYGITLEKNNYIKYQEYEGAAFEHFSSESSHDFSAFQSFAENCIFADAMCPDDEEEWLETVTPDYVEEAAETLPEGWYWKMFDDDTGLLISPSGEYYYGYNKATYKTKIEYHKRAYLGWEIFKGSFKEYQKFAEKEVLKIL